MFGLSFGKLLVLAAVIAFVWFGWRKIGAIADSLTRRDAPPKPDADPDTIELVRDPKTGAYAPRERPEKPN